MLLRKTLSLSDTKLKAEGDSGHFSGYAAVFGNIDSDNDVIVRGAFAESLANFKPKMFFGHDWSGVPIGRWDVLKEDDHGLWAEGQLTLGVSTARDVHAAMQADTLDGLSVGGFVKAADWQTGTKGERQINRWTRLLEISPVVFPANAAARIQTVKGGAELMEAIEDAETIREIEQLLRDAAGLSKGAATALVARIKAVGERGEPAQPDNAEVIQALAQRIQRLAA